MDNDSKKNHHEFYTLGDQQIKLMKLTKLDLFFWFASLPITLGL